MVRVLKSRSEADERVTEISGGKLEKKAGAEMLCASLMTEEGGMAEVCGLLKVRKDTEQILPQSLQKGMQL